MMTKSSNSSRRSRVGFFQSDMQNRRVVDRWEARPLADSVMHLIWHSHQISRAEIARQIGISRSTVSEVIKDLLTTGYVKEVGSGASNGGRKPIVLEFQNDNKLILGIDIGATHVSATIIDLGGVQLAFETRRHSVRSDPEGTRNLVFLICDTCLDQVPNSRQRLLSIGVALPSPVDPKHPEWISEIVIPAWRGRSELERLHQHYHVPVYVDNDANLGALAEHRWGAGRGVADLTYFKIAYGLGAGFILGGEIYRGATGIAGEMGHMSIQSDGKQCSCGLTGCLITLVGEAAMEERVLELKTQYPESALVKEVLSPEIIEAAAQTNDELAIQLYTEVAEYMSIAIIGWMNMMNPSRIILGGALAKLQSMMMATLPQKIKDCSLVATVAPVDIKIGELGYQTECIGAATLALEEAFSEPGFYRADT